MRMKHGNSMMTRDLAPGKKTLSQTSIRSKIWKITFFLYANIVR